MTTKQAAGMRAHWKDPDVRRRRRAGVRRRRDRRRLDARIARLERGIASWADHDPVELQRPEPLMGGMSIAEMLDDARNELQVLSVQATILDQWENPLRSPPEEVAEDERFVDGTWTDGDTFRVRI